MGLAWVFFDLGGTLLNEDALADAIYTSAYKRLAEAGASLSWEGLRALAEELIVRRVDGRGGFAHILRQVCRRSLDQQPAEKTAEMVMGDYRELVTRLYADYVTAYPEAPLVLGELRSRHRLGVVSNHIREARTYLAEKWRIASFFDAVIISSEVGVSKPDPGIFRIALERASCQPYEALMVGDRYDNDIGPARKIGMRTVRVQQGPLHLQRPMAGEEADAEAVRLAELPPIIRRISAET